MQVQVVDQTTHPPKCHSFVGLDRQIGSSPPALLEGEKERKRKKEKFYIYLDYTHTHPAGAGSTLKGKKKEKADTDDGQKARTAQGGAGGGRERTDLQNQPTRRKTWQKQSTHLNPTTHYGEAQGKN